jgi:hypothetical protein
MLHTVVLRKSISGYTRNRMQTPTIKYCIYAYLVVIV